MLESGLKHQSVMVVTEGNTANFLGSGDMEVLATPEGPGGLREGLRGGARNPHNPPRGGRDHRGLDDINDTP